MATEAQAKANKANSKLSTGPTSEGGKNISRLNALSHGYYAKIPFLPGQRRGEWQPFLAKFVEENGVATFPQFLCAAQAAQADFRLAHLNDQVVKINEEQPERLDMDMHNLSEYDERRLDNLGESILPPRNAPAPRPGQKPRATPTPQKGRGRRGKAGQTAGTHAPIPAAVEEPPIPNESSPAATVDNEAELERQRQIREESEKFYQEMAGKGWSEEEQGELLTTYLKIRGLSADPPQPTVN